MDATALPTGLTVPLNKQGDVVWLSTFEAVMYVLIFVLGTAGNGLVIFNTGFRMKKTVQTVWYLNLAIADFTFSFFLLFNIVQASLQNHWPFGRVMCKFRHALVILNLFASIYLLVVISVDRCVSVWCPVWALNHRTPRLASFVVLGVWILALLSCSPQLYYKDTRYDNVTNTIHCRNNYQRSTKEGRSTRHAMGFSRSIFGFLIPFTVIAVCYGAIVVKLRRNQMSQSSRPFKVITAVIVAFFVCWFPYHVFYFLKTAASDELQRSVLIGLRLSYSLGYFNSCLNPILYFFMGHNFKERLRCSFLLSAFDNAFNEDSSHSSARTKPIASAELDSHSL